MFSRDEESRQNQPPAKEQGNGNSRINKLPVGDQHYNVPELRSQYEQQDRLLVTTRYSRYPHTDDGMEV